jgi:hypothetical protein
MQQLGQKQPSLPAVRIIGNDCFLQPQQQQQPMRWLGKAEACRRAAEATQTAAGNSNSRMIKEPRVKTSGSVAKGPSSRQSASLWRRLRKLPLFNTLMRSNG